MTNLETWSDLHKRIDRGYEEIEKIWWEHTGYLYYRLGTGENIEILFIKVNEARKGIGTSLIRAMVLQLVERKKEPYNSVFVFTRKANEEAKLFYESMGFVGHEINGLYTEPAILYTIEFKKLKELYVGEASK